MTHGVHGEEEDCELLRHFCWDVNLQVRERERDVNVLKSQQNLSFLYLEKPNFVIFALSDWHM